MIKETLSNLQHLWYRYKLFVQKAISNVEDINDINDIETWKEKLFTICITYSLPFSLIAFIPSVIIAYQQNYPLKPVIDTIVLVSIIAVSFNNKISILYRKAFVVIALYTLAIFMMAYLGSFGMGSIYMLALSVFISLLYSSRVVYASIVVNFLIYTAFGLIINLKLFDSPLVTRYNPALWLAYSSNAMFLNLVIIVQVRNVIRGLENNIIKRSELLKTLQLEFEEKEYKNQLLHESETHYKSLFVHNPSPMWIFDAHTLRFLQVNEAAIERYGYTDDEFMAMTIKDIRSSKQLSHLMATLQRTVHSHATEISLAQHQDKSGEMFYAEVRCSPILFNGREARLVIARNITAQIEYIKAIEKQNDKLHKIAYMQSHIVRAPLARIMALADLIKREYHENPDPQIITFLDESVNELDTVIRDIINHTEEVLPDIALSKNPLNEVNF